MQHQTQPAEPPTESKLPLEAWNMMNGIDWNAIPIVSEYLGIEDIDGLISQLMAIRDYYGKR